MIKNILGGIFTAILYVGTSAAQVKVSGTVSDAQGVLPGASVVLQGSTRGTVTDAQGRFTLDVPDAATGILEVRFLGMDEVNLPLNGRTYMEIRMTESANQLDEVIVMGYGNTVRKGDVSGSVSTVSGDVLARVPVSSAAEAMVGKMAGVQVTMADGSPDAEISIRVRGGTSINNDNSPLIIVDGFPVDNLNDVPPSEIENISVLKDASTTAIYGARGANGVVIVTTKQAKGGKTVINVNSYMQLASLSRKLHVLDPYEFVMLQYEYARLNSTTPSNFIATYGDPKDPFIYKGLKGTDWQKEALASNPITHNHNISINGGNNTTRFLLSLNFENRESVLISNDYTRTNVNFKLNHDLFPGLSLDYNTRFSTTSTGGGGTGGSRGYGGMSLSRALRYKPTDGLRDFMDVPVVDEDGGDQFYDPEDPEYEEPYSPRIEAQQNYSERTSWLFNMSGALNWTIVSSLTARSEFGIDFNFMESNRFYAGETSIAAQYGSGLPMLGQTYQRRPRYRWTNTLSYAFRIADDHRFRVMAGHEMASVKTITGTYRTTGFPSDIEPKKAIANIGKGNGNSHSSTESAPDRNLSFFGSLNYDYKSRYFLTATFRADGSSKFAPGNQWAYFPAAAVSWSLHNEAFLKNVKEISNLRLRASYGSSGNSQIGDDRWRKVYSVNTSYAPGWGEVAKDYYTPGTILANEKIKWETTITRNLGLDFGLYGERINGTLEYYWNTTKDLLVESKIPGFSGYSTILSNVGQTSNRGIELTLNSHLVKRNDFNLNFNFNIGRNQFKVDKLASGEDVWTLASNWVSLSDLAGWEDYRLEVGKSMGIIYGYVYDGFYTVDDFLHEAGTTNYTLKKGVVDSSSLSGTPRPGNAKFRKIAPSDDVNPLIDDEDRTYIGNTTPKFSGGFGVTGNWKNFDFTVFFNFMYGFDVYNAMKMRFSSWSRNNSSNLSSEFSSDKRFRYFDNMGNDLRTDPILLAQFNENASIYNPISMTRQVAMSYIIEDGSFLRLNNVQIGYTLPAKLSRKIGMNRLRFYATGYNLHMWTKYSGYDPEVNVQKGLTPGVDDNSFPRASTYTFGVNITF